MFCAQNVLRSCIWRNRRRQRQRAALPSSRRQSSERRRRQLSISKARKTGSPRDMLNAKIRAELLSAHAEADQEYINLTAELKALDARVKELRCAKLEDFEGPLDSEALGAGWNAAGGGAVGGAFAAWLLLPVILVIAQIVVGVSGHRVKGNPEVGTIMIWACVAIAIAFAILTFFAEARKDSRTRTRNAQLVHTKRKIKERRVEHEHVIAQLQRKAAELRGQLDRIALSDEARKLLWERDNKTCYLCGKEIEGWQGEYMHVDHVFPWSQGGANNPENLRATHVACNLKKSDRIISAAQETDARGISVPVPARSKKQRCYRREETGAV